MAVLAGGRLHRPDSGVTVRFYIPAEESNEARRAFWDRVVDFTMKVVTTEDFAQQEAIWRNVRSGHLPAVVFGRNEPALIHYHRAIDAALGRDTTVPSPDYDGTA